MKVLIWNVRGLLSSCRRLRQMIRCEGLGLIAVIEPFLSPNQIEVFACKLNLQFCFASTNCKIWLFWSGDYSVNIMADIDQFVHCNISNMHLNFEFDFVAVYAKHTRAERQTLWSQLSILTANLGPVLIGGDFNSISSVAEYRGNAIPDLGGITDFSNFIVEQSLIDTVPTGGLYTWSGVRSTGRVWKRLDRFLMTTAFRDFFTDARVELKSRATSDHSPIILTATNSSMTAPKQYRFQNMWISHPGFQELVSTNWIQPADGGGMRALSYKLKRLKQALCIWNKEVFGNIFDKVKSLERSVTEAEQQFDDNPNETNREILSKEQALLQQALKQEECFWKQKARIKWLREGDANTKFFHETVKDRHRRQRISSIKNNEGTLLTSQLDIQTEAVNFFANLYTAEECSGYEMALETISNALSDDDIKMLTSTVSRQEVKEAVWDLDPDSAAGPDGFSGSFYRSCWDTIHNDVYMAVLDFFVGVPVPKGIASAQIVLIPKKQNPVSFADFRPICLCSFASKIFTRITTSRLRQILPKLISREQTGFVESRNIQDNVLLAFELIQYLDKRCRGSNVAIKLDMMKAFDRVDWPFLQKLLTKFGFPETFVRLIMNNLSSTRLSIMVNGISCGYFQPTRGVKQGDPLSPILFILISEVLSRMLIHNIGTGLISPYATSLGCPTITHLAFADDIIIFVNGGLTSLKRLSNVLKSYQKASGQRINYHKSFFVASKRCPTQRINAMERALQMRHSKLPFKYLGINLFRGRNRVIHHHHILESIDRKLLGWQRQLLSPGGRLTLIKHVLAAIPLYSMAVVQLPKQIIKDIEQRIARFFWGFNNGKPKHHWASWKKLCYPVEEGGLGLRSLMVTQLANAAHLWYKFRTGSSIWTDYMRIKYHNEQRHPTSSHVWKRMMEVSEMVEEHLLATDDKIIWTLSSTGEFTTHTAYDLFRPKTGVTLSSKCIWMKPLPAKISIFMWKTLRRLLPFPDCLERFGINLPSVCPFCWNATATMEHCLFSCSKVALVWSYLAAIFDVNCSNVSTIRAACHSWWLASSTTSISRIIINLMPSIILWKIWCSYNAAIYEETSFSPGVLINMVKREFLLLSIAKPMRSNDVSDLLLIREGFAAFFSPPKRRITAWIKWFKPPSGRLKLNTDATFSSFGAVGGACIRDSAGHLVTALSFPLDASSAQEAEVLALHFALTWCASAAKFPTFVEVDSSNLVSYVQSDLLNIPWKIKNAISQIRNLLLSWSASLSHIYREANKVADALALFGISRSYPSIYFDFFTLPAQVQDVFLYDFRGFTTSRLINQ
ncbi:uncharacterized protein LOC116025505 [Ipomoea triloba]|uniref:uncharacterized protein LOC116025505 n=1 Tax=Ipomoea triloba TaxID=35885 RepID=UPI00125D86A9|nr:uncharacterized protein LOC116025505 [Ipomoea triloba]